MMNLRGKKPNALKYEKKNNNESYTDLAKSGFYYSTKWRKVRKYILDKEPLCRRCLDVGKIKPADMVDHIIPISFSSSEELKFGEDNLQPLCFTCHRIVTNEDRGKNSAKNKARGKDLMKELSE